MLLKRFALLIMPGVGFLYFVVGIIFGLSWMVWVLGVIIGVILYLGILIMATSKYDGHIIITQVDGKRIFTLELETDPDDLMEMESITFQVVNQLEIRNINLPYNGD